jgi:hypothetical protein
VPEKEQLKLLKRSLPIDLKCKKYIPCATKRGSLYHK